MNKAKKSGQAKLRLILFSTGETNYRDFEFSLRRILLWIASAGLSCFAFFIVAVTLMNSIYQNTTNNSLLQTNSFLKQKIKSLQNDIEHLDSKLRQLEDDTGDLEVLVGLSESGVDSIALQKNSDFVMASMPVDYQYDLDLSQYQQ